jgi:hypothetical protein
MALAAFSRGHFLFAPQGAYTHAWAAPYALTSQPGGGAFAGWSWAVSVGLAGSVDRLLGRLPVAGEPPA